MSVGLICKLSMVYNDVVVLSEQPVLNKAYCTCMTFLLSTIIPLYTKLYLIRRLAQKVRILGTSELAVKDMKSSRL